MSDSTSRFLLPVRENHQGTPDKAAAEPTSWPLRVYTLGRFAVVRDGVPLQFERKAQKRPVELLQALIAFGGRQVSQFQLEDALWPNAPLGMAQNSFTTALHRLRKLIGSRCLMLRDGKLTLDPQCCWVDVWAFERQLSQIENCLLARSIDPAELFRQVARTMAGCQGQFLGLEAERDWMIPLREKLRHRVRRLFKEAGPCLGRDGQCQQAIALYHKALEVDPLAEEFYRRLMICYDALGCHSEAHAIYHSCRKVLQSQLRMSPSPFTEAVMKTLRLQAGNMSVTTCDACRNMGNVS